MSISAPRPLTAQYFDELQLFLNKAYGRAPEDDRQQRMPGACEPTDESMGQQYALLDRGRIVAAAGLYPIRWRIGDTTLRIACIGNVGVDPAYRNQGFMQTIMKHLVQRIGEEQYPLALLGGQRQRYQYFGWERSGVWIRFIVTRNNLRHSERLKAAPPVSLEPLQNDPSAITSLAELHDACFMHCERPTSRFDDWLYRWGHRPMLARDADGNIAGYVVIKEETSHVTEIRARDMDTALAMVRALVEQQPDGRVTVQLELDGDPLMQALGEIAEEMHLNSAGNWQVFDWPITVATLLAARQVIAPLPDGSVTLGIQGQPSLRLRVQNGRITCDPITHAPDVTADAMTMTRLLFGPLPPSMVMPLPPQASILNAWCPLPLSISHQDRY